MTPEMMMDGMGGMGGMGGAAPPGGIGIISIVVLVIWLLLSLSVLAGFIMTLIALWRGANAHRSIAGTLTELVEVLKEKG